jgi:hypothetical protein
MKKLILIFILALASSAQATLILNEQFDYPDGSLDGQGAWSRHSGTAGQIQVAGNAISVNDAQSEDVNVNLGISLGATESIFAGFDLSVTASTPVGGSDYEYFAHFGTGSLDFTARVDVVAPTSVGDYSLGISAGTIAEAVWISDLTFGTTYRAIIGYNRATGLAQLWVDAANMGDTFISSTTADDNAVSGFYLRESASTANETIQIDNLLVATTFGEAVSAIPEPSSFALLALGIAGLVGIRRRR